MKILDLLTGRKADDAMTLAHLADALAPASLPAHLATTELCMAYRGAIEDLYESTPPGGDGVRARIGQQRAAVDALIPRLQIADKIRAALAQRASDQSGARKRLATASKTIAAAEAAHREATEKRAAVAARLAELQGAREVIERASADDLNAARERLDAAVLAGDQAQELAASRDVAALQSAQLVPSAEAAALALRIERTAAHLDTLDAAVTTAAATLATTQREQVSAEIELAKAVCDEASDRYALALLSVMRAAGMARQYAFTDITNGLQSLSAATLWVGDHRRTWFDAVDSRVNTGHVHLARVLALIAAVLDGAPLDLALLREDLRPARQSHPVAA